MYRSGLGWVLTSAPRLGPIGAVSTSGLIADGPDLSGDFPQGLRIRQVRPGQLKQARGHRGITPGVVITEFGTVQHAGLTVRQRAQALGGMGATHCDPCGML